jgi:proline iminopeptidase
MDRLADAFRLIYYDQRGRGRSARGVQPGDVTIESEVEDVERVRRHFQVESVAVLGHSWGGLLAMEYAIRHPDRVSHLILMNTAPASGDDRLLWEEHLRHIRAPADVEAMQAIARSARYQAGDLEAEAQYYRLHFKPAVRRPEHVEAIVGRLRSHFTADGVRTARAIEVRLYDETWSAAEFDLMPRLRELQLPTLVLHGRDDFIRVDIAARIAEAIPGALLRDLPGCGHFAYLEAPERVHQQIAALFATK